MKETRHEAIMWRKYYSNQTIGSPVEAVLTKTDSEAIQWRQY